MCLVSNKLKLCTCSKDEAGTFENYWVFHRYNGKNPIEGYEVMGSLIFDVSLKSPFHYRNKRSLLKRINEPDAIDIDLKPKEEDRLELVFNYIQPNPQPYFYGFRFHNGKWVHKKFEPFEWMRDHSEIKDGPIKLAIEPFISYVTS
jgi:hypothetical protein